MNRDIDVLSDGEFDVLIVGGGVHGACAARDAALRGLTVGLIDRGDFSGATSHNSLKTIHGGIRYLQHLNFKRAIQSIREQLVFLRTAPHLVQPLRFLMPTYGWGMRGPLAMGAGIILFEALSAATRLFSGHPLTTPQGRLVSSSRCSELAPGIDTDQLTGGAIWADAQVAFADKAVLQMLQHAEDQGAKLANYVEARSPLRSDDGTRVIGVNARDNETGQDFAIKARIVINAAGPWIKTWLGDAQQSPTSLDVGLVKSMNLVVNKPAPPMAIGIKSSHASDSKVGSSKRLFFVVPWQGKAVIGTTHFTHSSKSVDLRIDQGEVNAFVEEFNACHPVMEIGPEDVLYCYQGLTPGDDSVDTDGAKMDHSKVVDHGHNDGLPGLISIVGIKWTTARGVAEAAVDAACKHLARSVKGATGHTDIPDYPHTAHKTEHLSDEQLQAFTLMHINQTQALHLNDIVLRRCNDLVLGTLSMAALKIVLDTMAAHFSWTQAQVNQEIELLKQSGVSSATVQRISQAFPVAS